MLNILFPRICNACNTALSGNEKVLCTLCRHKLPLTNFHITNNDSIKLLFDGKINIEQATSLFFFHKKSNTQELLHNLKYRKQEQVSYFLGKWLGLELAKIDTYKAIDIVIPVPMHLKKKRKRGFNQVTGFGIEIAKALDIPFSENILVKNTTTKSQVFKQRLKRFTISETEKNIYSVINTLDIKNKHILLVDDIITTGATLEHCGTALLKEKGVKLSIATMATAN